MAEEDYVVVQRDEGKESLEAWEEYEFAELCDITRGASPRPIHDWISDQGIPWLKIADASATHSRYITQTRERIKSEGITKSVSVIPGDLILSNSATPGIPKFVGIAACIHDGWLLLRNMRHLEKLFCYYLLLFERPRIVQQGSGTVFTNLKTEILKRHRVKVPPLSEQRAIAHVLGTLDDKIELNRRMNETLEGMARALFKSWFVDFEPVRAKMEGRWRRGESLPGLPADLYDVFPERLAPSELGEIPEGWEVGVLNDAIEILSGGTPKTSVQEYWNGGIPWYTAKDAPSLSDIFVLTTERSISKAGVENSSTKVLPAGTTVITARGTVGRLACLGIPMAMNQTCYGLRGASGYPEYFTYWNVRNTVSDLQARTHGTIFDTITRQTFKIAETLLPPITLAKIFESAVRPGLKRILGNLQETQHLARQRDALLPGLVSGEVRVGTFE